MRIASWFIVLAIICSGCSERKPTYTAALPAAGDEARLNVSWPSGGDPKVTATATLSFRCRVVHKQKAYFDIYYPTSRKPAQRRYTVIFDYAARDPLKRAVVQKETGELLRRGQAVDTIPIPFFFLLTSTNAQPELCEFALEDGCRGAITRGSFAGATELHGWTSTFWCKHNTKSRSELFERQWWKEGDWIWSRLVSTADSDGRQIEVVRPE